jgi:tetratricopeptide (TPR) repeat protein
VLAGALRDLTLWLDTPAHERAALFSSDAAARRSAQITLSGIEEALWVPVFTLSTIAEDPTHVAPSRLLYACRRVASWAEERGRPGTKLAFTQAAALLSPADAKLALDVAKLARDSGDHARAESWFRHTVRLARRDDWENYVWAYVGLGVLYIRIGNIPAATVVMQRALRTAERHRLVSLIGVAHHHFFHLTAEKGDLTAAYQHVHAALDSYRQSDGTGLPDLAADVARFWLHIGKPGRALPLFESSLAALKNPNIRAMVSANSAWAAALIHDRSAYERIRNRTLKLIEAATGRARLDEAFTILSCADLEMAELERALSSAREALRLACATGNAEVRILAEDVRSRASSGTAAGPPHWSHIAEGAVVTRQAEHLAGDVLRALALQAC